MLGAVLCITKDYFVCTNSFFHYCTENGDFRFLQAANACRYWPKGRGIYHNKNKTFLVWVNEEDHLRIISMQNGGNVGQVGSLHCTVNNFFRASCIVPLGVSWF